MWRWHWMCLVSRWNDSSPLESNELFRQTMAESKQRSLMSKVEGNFDELFNSLQSWSIWTVRDSVVGWCRLNYVWSSLKTETIFPKEKHNLPNDFSIIPWKMKTNPPDFDSRWKCFIFLSQEFWVVIKIEALRHSPAFFSFTIFLLIIKPRHVVKQFSISIFIIFLHLGN